MTCAGLDVPRPDGGVIMHFREQAAKRRPGMVGMVEPPPFECAEKLLPDRRAAMVRAPS